MLKFGAYLLKTFVLNNTLLLIPFLHSDHRCNVFTFTKYVKNTNAYLTRGRKQNDSKFNFSPDMKIRSFRSLPLLIVCFTKIQVILRLTVFFYIWCNPYSILVYSKGNVSTRVWSVFFMLNVRKKLPLGLFSSKYSNYTTAGGGGRVNYYMIPDHYFTRGGIIFSLYTVQLICCKTSTNLHIEKCSLQINKNFHFQIYSIN